MGGVEIEHTFCDNNLFCQQVLKKHWPEAKIYGDIRTLTANPTGEHEQRGRIEQVKNSQSGQIDILTGGFPCQPFSAAGKRQGKEDDRYLWPEMLRVIKEFRPTWIIGENVAGILNMAEQQSDSDLEAEDVADGDQGDEPRANGIIWGILDDLEQAGYSVQTFVIPACAVGAPHRRDRVWIVANSRYGNGERPSVNGKFKGQVFKKENAIKLERPDSDARKGAFNDPDGNQHRGQRGAVRKTESLQGEHRQAICAGRTGGTGKDVADTDLRGIQRHKREGVKKGATACGSEQSDASDPKGGKPREQAKQKGRENIAGRSWEESWLKVATDFCRMDDGLPVRMDGFECTKAGHREHRLKGLGNAIVPQVAMEIMKAIKLTNNL